jgi:hypothetical protein
VTHPLIQHLYVIRAQVDLAIAAFEEVLAPIGSPAAPIGCSHPAEKVYDAATMDKPNQVICGVCGLEFEGPG